MSDLYSIFLVAVSLLFAVPLASAALPRDLRWFPVPLLVGFGLSLGVLTLSLAFVAISPWPTFGLSPAFVVMAIVGAGGLLWYVRTRNRHGVSTVPDTPVGRLWAAEPLLVVALGAIILLVAGMVLVSLYYPFVGSDAIAIYSFAARKIYIAGGMDGWRIPEMDWYAGSYPLLLPLSYVYTWLATGEVNEYLPKVYPAAFHVATVGATYALGRILFSHRAGVLAALVLALTPFFSRWDNYGIADIPVTFFTMLSTIMMYHWLKTLQWRSAILAGVMFGLALWTKNSAVPFGVFLLAIIGLLGFVRWRDEAGPERRKLLVQALVMVGLVLAIAGWWYVRNWVLYDYMIPKRALWTDRVDRSVLNIIPILEISRVAAPLYFAALVYAVWRLARGKWDWARLRAGQSESAGVVVLLLLLIPFFILWWYSLSFTSRYLAYAVPLVALLSGFFLAEFVWPRIPRSTLAVVGVGALIIAASFFSAYRAREIEIAWRLVSEPMQTTAEKRMDRWGSTLTVYEHMRNLIDPDRPGQVITTSGHMWAFDQDPRFVLVHPISLSDLEGIDYLVWMSFMTEEYQADPARKDAEILGELNNDRFLRLVYEVDGHRVYKVGRN